MYALGTESVPTRVHPTLTGAGYRSSFHPYGAGRFHPQLDLSHFSAYPRHGQLPYDHELMQRKEYLLVCTDIITGFGLYCQRLFSSFFTFLLEALRAGCPPCRESLSLSTDTRYTFSGRRSMTFFAFINFFLLFLGAAGGSMGRRAARWGSGRLDGAAGGSWGGGRTAA